MPTMRRSNQENTEITVIFRINIFLCLCAYVCEIEKERAVKSKRKTLNSYLQRSILKRSYRVISILGCELKELELILALS